MRERVQSRRLCCRANTSDVRRHSAHPALPGIGCASSVAFRRLGRRYARWQDSHVIETGNAFDCLDIPSYEICNMDGRKVVLYSVLCKKDSRSWIAQRRYSDLRDLHLRVCKLGPTWHISMPFPGKRRFRSNQDPAFLDGRRSRMAE